MVMMFVMIMKNDYNDGGDNFDGDDDEHNHDHDEDHGDHYDGDPEDNDQDNVHDHCVHIRMMGYIMVFMMIMMKKMHCDCQILDNISAGFKLTLNTTHVNSSTIYFRSNILPYIRESINTTHRH